jgi:hypothetical protein
MPENTAPNLQPKPGQPAAPAPAPAPAPEYGHVPMGEEFDKAKWTLPPIVPVLIAFAAVIVVVVIVSFGNRAKPVIKGTITKVATADQEGNTMAALQVKLDNVVDKQLWISNIDSELVTADGKKFTDHAPPAKEIQEYLQAFPPLQEAKAEPLHEELKIAPRTSFTGVTVFSYPVDAKTFDQRKSLTLRIEMYDQSPLVIKMP